MRRTVTVGPEVGLHARPAAAFVATATKAPGTVRIGREPGALVDGKSIVSVLALGARPGDELVLEVDDEPSLVALASIVEQTAAERR